MRRAGGRNSFRIEPTVILVSLSVLALLTLRGLWCILGPNLSALPLPASSTTIAAAQNQAIKDQADVAANKIVLNEARREVSELQNRLERYVVELKATRKLKARSGEPEGCASASEYAYWKSNNQAGVLRVLNWNLWNLQEQWNLRRDSIAATLRELRPHVVGVQEVRILPNGRNQLEELAALAGYPHVLYQHAGERGRHEEEGVGIMSMLPIVAHRDFPIPRSSKSSDLNPRTMLRVTVDVASLIPSATTPILVDVHVTHISYDSGEQCRQMTHLRRFLDDGLDLRKSAQIKDSAPLSSLRGGPRTMSLDDGPAFRPQIVMGDLNIYRDWEWPMDFLRTKDLSALMAIQTGTFKNGCWSHVDRALADYRPVNDAGLGGFSDVWEDTGNAGRPVGNEFNAWTFPNLRGATNDFARCDRILLRSPRFPDQTELTSRRSAVIGCSDILGSTERQTHSNEHGAPLRQSDHRAVIADFEIGRPKTRT